MFNCNENEKLNIRVKTNKKILLRNAKTKIRTNAIANLLYYFLG